MKSVFNRVCICLAVSLAPGISFGASAEIDRALDILMQDYNLDNYLDVTDESSLNQSGFYIVQAGDTLDEIILKLIGETPIRNRVLRDAFVQANPNSFRNSNPNYMLAGVRLRVPDAGDILELLFDMNSPIMRSANQSRENWVHFP